MSPGPFVHEKHDIGLLRSDGSTKVGLMLATDSKGIPKYQMFAKKKLADQFFTGVPDYGYQDPEEEVPISQDDWRSGLGLEIADRNDSKRYHKSTMDMRFKGKGLAGTKATAVTKPVVLVVTITDADMELGSASWVNEDAFNGTQAHGGVQALYISNAIDESQEASQTLSGYLKGATYTFTCWVYIVSGGGGCTAKVGINDGVDTTYGSTTSTYDTWVQLTVTKTLSTVATTCSIRLWSQGSGIAGEFWFDDAAITGTALTLGTSVTSAEFNDLLYVSFGRVLAKLNGTGDAFTAVMYFAVSITSLCAFSDDRLYIALGLSNNYWYMSTAEAFTESTAVVNDFKYFTMVNAATPVMWGSDSAYTIRSTTAPQNGGTAWSGQTTVDTSYYDITKLLSKSGACYIMKENRPYYLNSSGAVQSDLAPEMEALKKSTDNGKNTVVWLDRIYMPWGEQALLEEDSGTNTWRSPSLAATEAAEYNGQVFAVAGDDQYLYAILDYTTKIEVLSGRLETIGSTTSWVWHCIAEITLTGCETAFISSVYQKRLWITSTTASEDLNYLPLPIGYADAVNDTNRSFLTATTMETSWLHGSFPLTTKAFTELTVVMGHTYNTGRYFTVKYKKLGDSSWTTIGNYTGSATSMTQSRYIPADASSNNPKATMFKLQFTAVTDDTTITPILLNYLLKGVLYPGQRDIIACSVKCSNELVLKDGTIDRGSRDNTVTVIDEARNATWPITFYDIDGATVTGKPLPVNPLFTVTKVEKGRVIESEYNLLLQKVSLS